MLEFLFALQPTVTKEMLKEAKSAGHIKIGEVAFGQDKIQIMTIEDLMTNHHPNLPNVSSTFKKAQRNQAVVRVLVCLIDDLYQLIYLCFQTNHMKRSIAFFLAFIFFATAYAQQNDWSSVEKVFGKKGTVQNNVFKVTYPRSDLTIKVSGFKVAPGFALGSWIGFMSMDTNMNMQSGSGPTNNDATMMGDLVLLDNEVPAVLKKLVEVNLKVTAIHNHLINESPNVKYVHFSGSGDRVKLAEAIKSVLAITGTPLTPPQSPAQTNIDWSKVEALLGTNGKHNGMLLQYSFPRKEKLKESGMEMPPYMGMATAINFQKAGDSAAITGDFVLLADEVNPVIKILIENGITPTALHNHMIHDEPRLFMMHFWAIDNPEKLAKVLQLILTTTNHAAIKK
ncbi:MAG: DUF1259 domain-containing protein [Ginsengibacter sp.]